MELEKEKHIHKALYDEDGNLTDDCAECGESFRNLDVHYTAEECGHPNLNNIHQTNE